MPCGGHSVRRLPTTRPNVIVGKLDTGCRNAWPLLAVDLTQRADGQGLAR